MAVAANEIQLTVTGKVPLENNRALYFGTAQGGTGYATGGAAIGEEPTNSRHKLPERLDVLVVQGGLPGSITGPNKYKLQALSATEAGAAELGNGKTMATAVPAGTPFFAVGLG